MAPQRQALRLRAAAHLMSALEKTLLLQVQEVRRRMVSTKCYCRYLQTPCWLCYQHCCYELYLPPLVRCRTSWGPL